MTSLDFRVEGSADVESLASRWSNMNTVLVITERGLEMLGE